MQLTITPYQRLSAAVAEATSKSSIDFFKMLILCCLAYVALFKDISIQVGFNTTGEAVPAATAPAAMPGQGEEAAATPMNTSLTHDAPAPKATAIKATPTATPAKKAWKDRKANNFANLTFILSPDYAQRKGIDPAVVEAKKQKCRDYVERYAHVAQREMAKYGIPASITLGQALLESNVGDSRLSVESNNHFGIKCRSKCKGCTCRNYTDDDVYDMFRVFESPWESFREHSILLDGPRYKKLQALPMTDYKGWAHGLKKAGYATDKRYAEKLIKIIETLGLHKYDRAA